MSCEPRLSNRCERIDDRDAIANAADTANDDALAALKKARGGELSEKDRRRLVAVFEDRTRVVDMYRKRGVTCYQVATGDF